MGEEGLEPSHLAVPDPKSGASTSFATRPTRRATVLPRNVRGQQGLSRASPRPCRRGGCRKRNRAPSVSRRGPASESGGNRTHNLWIKSPLLCQLSYAPGFTGAALAARRPRWRGEYRAPPALSKRFCKPPFIPHVLCGCPPCCRPVHGPGSDAKGPPGPHVDPRRGARIRPVAAVHPAPASGQGCVPGNQVGGRGSPVLFEWCGRRQ